MKFLQLLMALGLASTVFSAELPPDQLVKDITLEVLAIVKQDKAIQSGDRKKLLALVEEKILPYFNFSHMTALALGRNWNKANPDQQQELIKEFRTLLVNTYSGALSTYRNQELDFRPYRGQPNDTQAIVKTLVIQPGHEAISIDYTLEKTAEGWKVYDIIVGGVSLVTNYRGSFAQQIRDSGVDGLIKSLQNKNRYLKKAQA